MEFNRLLSAGGACATSIGCALSVSALLVSMALLASLSAYIAYQLFLHPLAKYSGPLLGRITPLYDLYHAYAGDKHLLLYHLHRQYGRIVRFTPNTLSINDLMALKIIYGHHANARKSEFYRCFRAAPTAISTLPATETAHHARKRRLMAQAFSHQSLKRLERYVIAHVQNLVDGIGRNVKGLDGKKGSWSRALNMQTWCNWLAFDIMGDLVFGKSFGTLVEHPENRRGIHLLMRAARRNYSVAAMPVLMYNGWEKWIRPFRSLYLDRDQYLAFGKQQVLSKMERDKESRSEVCNRKDIFSILLHAKDPETGEGVPLPELWMEGNTLIVAGSDTSSTTLAATLFYLLKNPHTLAKLEREIFYTFSQSTDIRMGPRLQSCTWLRACIDEAMRMSPAVAGLLPREILEGGLDIPSLDIADYIVNPFTFDPSRWLAEGHMQDKEALHSIFTPFSLGHRACLGKPLVYMELSIAIARLVFEFDMRLASDQRIESWMTKEIKSGKRHEKEYHFQDWFLSNNYGPFVEFRLRDVEEEIDSVVED